MLMAIRFSSVFLIFSSSKFEVLNPNYSNSLNFHDQETFSTHEYVITQTATFPASILIGRFQASTQELN